MSVVDNIFSSKAGGAAANEEIARKGRMEVERGMADLRGTRPGISSTASNQQSSDFRQASQRVPNIPGMYTVGFPTACLASILIHPMQTRINRTMNLSLRSGIRQATQFHNGTSRKGDNEPRVDAALNQGHLIPVDCTSFRLCC